MYILQFSILSLIQNLRSHKKPSLNQRNLNFDTRENLKVFGSLSVQVRNCQDWNYRYFNYCKLERRINGQFSLFFSLKRGIIKELELSRIDQFFFLVKVDSRSSKLLVIQIFDNSNFKNYNNRKTSLITEKI
eukprot:TRINITY_DN14535_c0_g1_i8.p2 TRINITY_DN14535_c0_g1~~TRINITY_DN14535_c0_g1_i8.p2  ORF type:complete len:132 (+),score=0.80 TRINITY_DN14535_c0_g1_i8:651-1046(+)